MSLRLFRNHLREKFNVPDKTLNTLLGTAECRSMSYIVWIRRVLSIR